jgi:hypothetical protein
MTHPPDTDDPLASPDFSSGRGAGFHPGLETDGETLDDGLDRDGLPNEDADPNDDGWGDIDNPSSISSRFAATTRGNGDAHDDLQVMENLEIIIKCLGRNVLREAQFVIAPNAWELSLIPRFIKLMRNLRQLAVSNRRLRDQYFMAKGLPLTRENLLVAGYQELGPGMSALGIAGRRMSERFEKYEASPEELDILPAIAGEIRACLHTRARLRDLRPLAPAPMSEDTLLALRSKAAAKADKDSELAAADKPAAKRRVRHLQISTGGDEPLLVLDREDAVSPEPRPLNRAMRRAQASARHKAAKRNRPPQAYDQKAEPAAFKPWDPNLVHPPDG